MGKSTAKGVSRDRVSGLKTQNPLMLTLISRFYTRFEGQAPNFTLRCCVLPFWTAGPNRPHFNEVDEKKTNQACFGR